MVKSGLTADATVSQYRLAVHLGMALLIFALLLWTAFDIRYGRAGLPRGHAAGTLVIVAVTILAGALVAGMDAGLLYNHYPLMGNGLIPVEYGEMGLMDAFENPAAAQFHHRWIAVLAVLAVITLALSRPAPGRQPWPGHAGNTACRRAVHPRDRGAAERRSAVAWRHAPDWRRSASGHRSLDSTPDGALTQPFLGTGARRM